MSYVIQRIEDNKYVTRPGSRASYTAKLEDARVFETIAQAERDKCGNEYITEVRNVFR